MGILVFLETDRLFIRSYTKQDKEFCLGMWCDLENGKYLSDPSKDHINEAYLKGVDGLQEEEEGYYLVVELKETHELVGTCCAFPDEDNNYDIGYCIHMSQWKKGFGSEMLQCILAWIKDKGGKSISAEIADDNAASKALVTKFGFYPMKATNFKKWGEDTRFAAHYYKLEFTN